MWRSKSKDRKTKQMSGDYPRDQIPDQEKQGNFQNPPPQGISNQPQMHVHQVIHMPVCGNLPGEGGFSDAMEDLFGGPNHYNKIRDASIPPPPGAIVFNTGTYVVHTVQTTQGAWHPPSNFGVPMGQNFATSSNSTGLAQNAPIPSMPVPNQLYQQKPGNHSDAPPAYDELDMKKQL